MDADRRKAMNTQVKSTIAQMDAGLTVWDLEAEQGLLGCMLLETYAYHQVADTVAAEAFYDGTHQAIFEAYAERAKIQTAVRPHEIFHDLRSHPGLQEAGGLQYLTDMVGVGGTGASEARSYAGIVVDLWQRRQLLRAASEIVAAARAGEASSAVIEKAEQSLLSVQVQTRAISFVSAEEAVDRVVEQLEHPEKAYGVTVGLDPLDEVTGGFMPGELWLLAGRPGMGKSAIAACAALNVAWRGKGPGGEPLGVMEISCEMTVEQLMRRHIADYAFELAGQDAPTYSQMRRRALTVEQREIFRASSGELRKLGTLRSVYRAGLTIGAIRSLARRQTAAWARQGIRPGLLILDHVGLIKSSQKTRSRTEDQGDVARESKELAGDLGMPVLGLVQLSREVEKRDEKRPMLADLRDSGEWEQNADGVVGAYRPSYYAQRMPEPKRYEDRVIWDEQRQSKTVEAILLKIREGEAQTIKLWADMGRNAIRACAPDGFYGRKFARPLAALLDPNVSLPDFEAGEFA